MNHKELITITITARAVGTEGSDSILASKFSSFSSATLIAHFSKNTTQTKMFTISRAAPTIASRRLFTSSGTYLAALFLR